MKPILSLVAVFLFSTLSKAQRIESDTSLIVFAPSIFAGTCIDKLSQQYGVRLEVPPNGYTSFPHYAPDSIELHNKRVESYYSARLGENWVAWMKDQLRVCESTTCNYDSVKKYQQYTVILMTPGSDSINDTHRCLFDNIMLYWMLKNDSMDIAVVSHSLPGEEHFALARANKVKAYFVSRGIAPRRIQIVDYGSASPIVSSEPRNERNCSISFRISRY